MRRDYPELYSTVWPISTSDVNFPKNSQRTLPLVLITSIGNRQIQLFNRFLRTVDFDIQASDISREENVGIGYLFHARITLSLLCQANCFSMPSLKDVTGLNPRSSLALLISALVLC